MASSGVAKRFELEAARDRPAAGTPDVGITMGSDTNQRVMAGGHDALAEFGIPVYRVGAK